MQPSDEPQEDVCMGCGRLIDPTTCGCGDAMDHAYDGHGPIPMGCDCCRHGDEYQEQRRVTRMLVDKVRRYGDERIERLEAALREACAERDRYKAALTYIANGNTSRAIRFAENVLIGDGVITAHQKAVRDD